MTFIQAFILVRRLHVHNADENKARLPKPQLCGETIHKNNTEVFEELVRKQDPNPTALTLSQNVPVRMRSWKVT